jgi:hypothetical protein
MRIATLGMLIPLFAGLELGAQSVLKTMKRLPDTGQNKLYSTAPGEDAAFSIYPPYFSVHADGTATDTVTGLMWQRFDGPEMTISAARMYCDTLTLGGFTDWKLPTLMEAFSILNHQNPNPALDITVFPKSAAEYWWTGTRQVNDSTRIWVTNAGGGAGNHPMGETVSAGGNKRFHARAVRYTWQPVSLASRFTDQPDGTCIDLLTGLVWFKKLQSDSLTWEQALWLADSSTAAGKSDWRLPNIKELQSISDPGLFLPSLSNKLIVFTGNRQFWSSTTLTNQSQSAWYLDSRYGITSYEPKTRRNDVLLVRQPDQPMHVRTETPATLLPWPNPFTHSLIIPNEERFHWFTLNDAAGKVVYSGPSLQQADFSRLKPGCYVLTARGRETFVFRVIRNE